QLDPCCRTSPAAYAVAEKNEAAQGRVEHRPGAQAGSCPGDVRTFFLLGFVILSLQILDARADADLRAARASRLPQDEQEPHQGDGQEDEQCEHVGGSHVRMASMSLGSSP